MAHSRALGGSRHLLLRPSRAGLFDLGALLLSSRIGKRSSVDSSWSTEVRFDYRFVIFLSLLVQRVLLLVALPMGWMGSMVDMCLNLLSSNGGCLGVVFNFFLGRLVIPNRASETFASTIGNLDTRVDLDSNIKPGDSKYIGALSLMASKAAYENEAFIKSAVVDHWKMELLGVYDFWNDCVNQCCTYAFIMRDPIANTIIVSFRGTQPFNAYEWCTDFDISWIEIPNVGKGHAGFMEALGYQQDEGWPREIKPTKNSTHPPVAYYFLRAKLRELLDGDDAKFVMTGHSLGGALAIMFPAILAIHEDEWLLKKLQGVYTFGQPRVGDAQFGDFVLGKLKENGVEYIRYVYCNDMVPRLPADDKALLFRHFGRCLYSDSFYIVQCRQHLPNKNYFAPWAAIPMVINAVWEIVRSFIIPLVAGRSYREGWFLKCYRLTGLILPGLPDHGPQDYDNVTRLGNLPALPRSS